MSAKQAPVTPLPVPAANPLELLTPAEVCERIPGVDERFLADLRSNGKGPAFMKPHAQAVVYDWADVRAWLESTKRIRADRFGAKS